MLKSTRKNDTTHGVASSAAVVERIKQLFSFRTVREIATKFEIAESTLSSSMKRDTIPFNLCIDIAKTYGVPLDWLIFGDVDGVNFQREISTEHFRRAYCRAEFDTAAGAALLKEQGATGQELSIEQQMLLTGWECLNASQQDQVFDLVRKLGRG